MSFVYPHNIPTIQLPYPAQQLTVRYRNQSPMEKTIQHLFSQNHTDLPNKAIIIPNINTYDFKSVLRNVICLAVYYNITVYRSFACFNHPPTNKTISYYIYTLEKILI